MEEKTLRTEIDHCPECGNENIIKDNESGEYVCGVCGLVVGKTYDGRQEWRAYDREQEERRTRVGPPSTYTIHDKGLSTSISPLDKDTYGRPLKPGQKETFYRLRKWQKRIRVSDATERSLASALAEIDRISGQGYLDLPKIVKENASLILGKMLKGGRLRGRGMEGVVAGAIYLACRQAGVFRTLDEISKASGVDRRDIARDYRFILKETGYQPPVQSPSLYVSKLTDELGITEGLTHRIISVAKEARLTSGRGPAGVAAAAAYIASVLTGEKKSQKDLAEKMRCTEVTIRNRYKELMEMFWFIVEL
jgi:transcription initiation factor TFIIB